MTRRRFARAATAGGAIVAVTFGIILLADRVVTPDELEESLAPVAAPPVTVEVEQRVIQTTLVGRGQVAFDGETTVALPALPGLDGSMPLVTSLPDDVTDLASGDVLMEVAYRPVILLEGPGPLVRDLTSGDRGPDVAVLQQALADLGLLDESDIDERFGPGTSAALADLYEVIGYAPPKRGGAVYATPAELHLTPSLPLVVRDTVVSFGEAVSPGVALAVMSSTSARLVVGLPSFEAALLVGGETVQIFDDATGDTTTGRIERVGTVPTAEAGGVPVVIQFEGELPDDRDYRVTIEVESTGDPVLAVPETALYLGTGDASFVLRIVAGVTERVTVEVGIVGSDGFAQITPASGTQLAAGDRVVVGEPP